MALEVQTKRKRMAKILLNDIKLEVESKGWKVLSTEYKNLKEEMQFECPEGHTVFLSWEKGRRKLICPICNQNPYKDIDIKAIPKPQGARRVLALDQSTKISGWSIFDDDKLVSYGIFQVASDDEMKRCSEVKSWLLSMIDNWKPDIIGLEGIQYQEKMGVTTFETLAELKGILRNVLYEHNIQTVVCPTNTWRAHCGVKGVTRSDKKASMKYLIKKWYDVSVTDDIADAIGIGKYVTETTVQRKKVTFWV